MKFCAQVDGNHPITCPECDAKMDAVVVAEEDETRVEFGCPMDVDHPSLELRGDTEIVSEGGGVM